MHCTRFNRQDAPGIFIPRYLKGANPRANPRAPGMASLGRGLRRQAGRAADTWDLHRLWAGSVSSWAMPELRE